MMGAFANGLSRLGFAPRSASPGMLFYGSDKEAFEAIAPVLTELSKADQRLEAYLCTKDAELRHWLQRTFPDFKVVPAPFAFGLTALIFIRRLRTRVVIALEEEVFPSPVFLKCLKKRSVSIVLMSGRGMACLKPRYSPEDGANLLLAVDQEANIGTSADERLTLIPFEASSAPIRIDQTAATAIRDQLIPLVGKNQKGGTRRDRPLRRMFAGWLQRRLDDPVFAAKYRRFVHRYDDLDELRQRLGNSETILCLGNGPSSEHPDLGEVKHDALFRVNHSWMNRSILTDPDVVFTGGYSAIKALNPPIFGLQHQTGETVLLTIKGPLAFRHPINYFSMERLGRYLDDFDWGQHRPTNGAAMIAMAVALKPKRLIIAGIDLFRHPDGSYPGDKTTPNAYTPAHSSDKELAFMFHHLDRFPGEVVIFGEILDREWRHFRERHQHHLDKVG